MKLWYPIPLPANNDDTFNWLNCYGYIQYLIHINATYKKDYHMAIIYSNTN